VTKPTTRRLHRSIPQVEAPVQACETLPDEALVHVIHYSESSFDERKAIGSHFAPGKDNSGVTWINVDGYEQPAAHERIGNCFGLHPLVLEDILSRDQRPKLDDYDDYLYIVLKMLDYDEAKDEILMEQVSLILGSGFVLSFQDKGGDVFDPVRERLRNGKGRIRKAGADYLAYALVDAIVDNYFVILEKIGDRIDYLEEELVTDPKPEKLDLMHSLKREMLFLRNSVWPLREVIGAMVRGGSPLIHESTEVYLRDVHDHTIQVIETIETFRDMLSGMLDIYLSSVSNRLNEVMKVLTIISTVFMPLTFIAGVYGMNFRHMPEIGWRWSYPVVLGVMLVAALMMLLYFRRKRWL